MYLRQSTSQDIRFGPFVDDTDGVTAETGLTIAQADMQLSKDGAAFAQKNASGNATHDTDGWYSTTLNTTDTATVGELILQVAVSGALPVWRTYWVIEEDVYDDIFGASAGGYLKPTTAGRTLDVTAGGTAGIDWANVEAPTTTVTLSNTTVGTTTTNTDMITTAAVNAEVDTALADIGLDHLLSAAVVGADVTDNSIFARLVSKEATADWDDYVNTTDSLQALRDQGDSAWITATGFSTHNAADVRTEMDSNSTQLAAIVADTNELQGDWVNGGRLDLILDARASQSSVDTIDGNVDAILVDTADMQPKLGTITDLGGGSTIGDNLSDMAGATFATSTDSLEAIRNRGDSAWTTGGGGSNPTVLQNTTIATLASQTSFTLTAGSADDDAYNNMVIIVEDQSTSTQKAVGVISDYTGSTRTVTLDSDPGIFTMAVGDTVDIVAVSPFIDDEITSRLAPTTAGRTLDVTAGGQGGIDLANVNGQTSVLNLTNTTIANVTTVATTTDVTNQVTADVTAISGDSGAADNLESDYDGTGYNKANSTIGTTTTNTDMITTAAVNAEVDTALADIGLDHLVSAAATGTDITDDSIIAQLVSSSATADWDDYDNTTEALQALRDRGDTAWITATGFSTHSAADVRTEMDSNSTQLAAIVADTNELQGDWVNGGRLDLILDARASQSSVDTIDGNVDAILLDTAEIGTAGAGLTNVPWNASWDAEVQSEVNDALVAIGLDHLLSASVAGSDITDDSIIAQLVSKEATADWDDYDNTTDSLQAIRDRGDSAWTTGAGGTPPDLLVSTTIATLASQTSFTLTAASADDDAYNDRIIIITDSSTSTQIAVGQVSDYTGSTRTVTLSSDPGIFTMAVGDSVDIMAYSEAAAGSGDWSTSEREQIRYRLQVDGTQSAPATDDGSQLPVDVTLIHGDATAASNAESFFDGTGYAGTNNVIPTVTDVTNQVTADVTAISGDSTAANNLEAMLDGTGATLTLDKLLVAANDSDGAIHITNSSGSGAGIKIEPNTTGLLGIDVNGGVEFTASGIPSLSLSNSTYTGGAFNIYSSNGRGLYINADSFEAVRLETTIGHTFTMEPGSGTAMYGNGDVLFTGEIDASNGFGTNIDADINAQVDAAIETYGLDHLLSASVAGSDITDDSIIAQLVSSSATADWDDFDNTTESLQALRDRGDAAWTSATGFSTHSAADVRTEMDSNSTQFAAIVADTNELQTDWANGGRLDVILDARSSQTSVDTIDGNVDAILVDTGTTIPAQITALNDLSTSDIDTRLAAIGLDHLVSASVSGSDVADDSIVAQLVSASGTADWDDYDNTTDSLQAIRDRGDSAWTTGAGGTPPQLLVSTTIATLTSQTVFTLTAGSSDNDAYNDQVIIITDSVDSNQVAVTTVSDYVGSTRQVTLADTPAFTIAVGDTVEIIAGSSGGSGGASASQIWSYADRTLSQNSASVTATLDGNVVNVYKGATWTIEFTGLTDASDYTKAWFTAKENVEDTDNRALVQANSADGLTRIDGQSAATSGNASVTIDGGNDKITVVLDEVESIKLDPHSRIHYDVKALNSSGNVVVVVDGRGLLNILSVVTRATS